jgi:hypothetical protein
MSLINDALKQARQAPPHNTPGAMPPLQPVPEESSSVFAWLIPAIVILLLVAAMFFIGWAVAHRTVHTIVNAPDAAAPPPVADISPPVVTPPPVASLPVAPPPVAAPAVEAPPPVIPADLPKLQGIFYSPTAPSAIVDGKTVRPGDQFRQYHVKAISKYAVTLVGPDHKEVQISMGN